MLHIDNLLAKSYADKDYSDQVQWLVNIFTWLRLPRDVENLKITRERVYSIRIKYLLFLLSRNPEWQRNFVSTVTAIMQTMSSVSIFTDVGMSLNFSFIQDFIRRLEEKILPQSALTENLSSLLLEVFPDEDESLLVDGIDEEVFAALLALFQNEGRLIGLLRDNIFLSLHVLTTQLLSNAFSVQREIEGAIKDSKGLPEARLQELVSQNKIEAVQSVLPEMFACLGASEKLQQHYYNLMQDKGIKVDCVFLLESQRRRIDRIRILLNLLNTTQPVAKSVRLFISTLILDIHHQKSLRSFFAENMNLLTQRIVSRNSDVGEHYVTTTWSEFRRMYNSAVGGGAVTSATVFLKLVISSIGIAGFAKGLLDSLNYSFSFLFIQSLGCTLATKQPSATAPYLAQSLKQSVLESRKAVIAILRTQFIAVLGNLTLVFPICFFVSWIFMYFGSPIMSVSEGMAAISSTDILGPSPIFAIFTGFLLFISSLIAGWVDNWMAIHNVPERVANHQGMLGFLGKVRTKKFSLVLKNSTNPYAASISLGFLLGLAPQFIKFMGLPLEARHITLSTGNFAAGLPVVLGQLEGFALVNSISGLLLIGILNIGVSFGLALMLAAISSKVRISLLLNLLKWAVKLIIIKPWLLIVPEKPDGQ